MAHLKTTLLVTAASVVTVLGFGSNAAQATLYQETDLVANSAAFDPNAAVIDPNLQTPWGISSSATSPFWVSDNNTNLSTLYNGAGTPSALTVTVNMPTGQVSNSDRSGFLVGTTGKAAAFIFASLDGNIYAWNGSLGTAPNTPSVKVFAGPQGASYTGLAQATVNGSTFLYAANAGTGTVTVLDTNFHPVTLSGNFTVPGGVPAGLVPFNTQVLNGHLFVTFANANANGGQTGGLVAEFDLNGNFINKVPFNTTTLNQPWGLDIAPAQFGQYSNDLLVGNLGSGVIDVYDPNTLDFLGQLDGVNGQPFVNVGLWDLINGNGGAGGDVNTVFFDSEGAPQSSTEGGINGVVGALTVVPEPASLMLVSVGVLGLGLIRRRPRFG